MAKIPKKTLNICYFRWEFMRRDPEYRREYQNFKVQLNDSDVGDAAREHNLDRYQEYIFSKFEMNTCLINNINNRFLPNPDFIFCELEKELDSYKIPILLFFSSMAVSTNKTFENQVMNPFIDDKLDVRIDLNAVNSLTMLREWVDYLIQYEIEKFKKVNVNLQRINIPKDFDDWGKIIQAGDLRNQGYSFPQIAKRFINDGLINNDDLETAKKSVKGYCKRYQELVNGGWRKIKYP